MENINNEVRKRNTKNEFKVEQNGKLIRTYSTKIHGKEAGKLAKKYALKIGANVK